MKAGWPGLRMNGLGTQGDETEGGAVVSFSQSLSLMRAHDINLQEKGQGDRGKKGGEKYKDQQIDERKTDTSKENRNGLVLTDWSEHSMA